MYQSMNNCTYCNSDDIIGGYGYGAGVFGGYQICNDCESILDLQPDTDGMSDEQIEAVNLKRINILENQRIKMEAQFTFEQALTNLKAGLKVQRAGWNGKGMFLFLVQGSQFAVNRAPLLGIYPEGKIINYQPHIDMKTADDTIVPWLASQSDLLATDWQLV